MRLQKVEREVGPGSPKSGASKFINSEASGGSADERKDKQDMSDLKGQNAQLQKRLEKYRKREMELLRALKAQQMRRTGDPNKGGGSITQLGGRSSSTSGEGSGGSPLRQQASE